MVDLVLKSGEALRRILDDILDLSKINAEMMPLVAAPFDLREQVNAAAELMRVRADEKGLAFHVEFGEGADGWFRGDAIRLRQIVSNLASNAIKFTESGQVRISVDAAAGEDVPMLHVAVTDTGIGFDDDEAVELVKTQAFDIILMDMQMPVMDGLTAIREMRSLESRGLKRTPIAMMTANTSQAHHEQAALVGADGFIAKPVTLQTLLDGIESVLAGCTEPCGSTSALS